MKIIMKSKDKSNLKTYGKHSFNSQNVGGSRVVWDKSVHLQYNENCHYLLIRVRRPDQGLIDDFKKRLHTAQIKSYCVYWLYGYFDVLVRVWASPQKFKRLIRLFAQEEDFVLEVQEFRVNDIEYLWTSSYLIHPPASRVMQHKKEIETICRQVDANKTIDEKIISRLSSEGLIHELDPIEGQCFKFFVVLSSAPGQPENKKRIRQSLHEFIKIVNESDMIMMNVSVYYGIGFGNYMVKAVVREYEQILECVRKIIDFRGLEDLRTTTYIIADQHPPESDNVDVDWQDLTGSLLSLEEFLGPEYAADIVKLKSDERNKVEALVNEFIALSDTEFSGYFKGIFTAYLKKQMTLLVPSLLFIFEMEESLRSLIIQLSRQFMGKDWFSKMTTAADYCGIKDGNKEGHKDPKMYTLHEVITVLNKLVSDGEIPSSEVNALLGFDWLPKLQAMRDYRNSVAHGRIFASKPLLHEKWPELARAVLEVGDMYNKLSQLNDKGEKSDGSSTSAIAGIR